MFFFKRIFSLFSLVSLNFKQSFNNNLLSYFGQLKIKDENEKEKFNPFPEENKDEYKHLTSKKNKF